MRLTFEEVTGAMAKLILAGAVEISLECMAGEMVLGWRYPGREPERLPFELEEEPCLSSSC
jgi:hypothetical protein